MEEINGVVLMLRPQSRRALELSPAQVELMHAYNSPELVVGLRATVQYVVHACGHENAHLARSLAIWAGKTLCWCKKRRYGFAAYRAQLLLLMAQAQVRAH